MGNALDAAKFSIERGNTGVGTKKTLLKGIDDFASGVKSWKENIDSQRLKLKTDTASKYREAEKEVYKNLPSDKTDRDLALNALSSYKDQLYGNMGLVQAGMIKPEDNLIFQENGKQSFEILANQINSFAERREETMRRAKGGYWPDEEGGPDVYHKPASGAYEDSLQDLQSRMGNPEFTEITFGENGMGRVTFFKTEVDELTGTRVLVKDKDGNPIPIDGLEKISVLSFDRGRNQRADRLDLKDAVMSVVGKDTALGQTFERMSNKGLLLGSIEDNQRANPQLKVMIDDGVATLTATADRKVSILSDNGNQGEQSIPLNVAQWDSLTDDQKKETVNYTWVDASGKTNSGTKSKYIKLVTSANGQIVPELSKGDIEAAENIARTSIYASLKADITDKGTKRSEFQKRQPNAQDSKNKDDKATVLLIDQAVTGNISSLEALVRAKTGGVVDYDITEDSKGVKSVVFTKSDGTVTNPIPLNTKGVDAGKLFSAEMGINAETYVQETGLTDELAKGQVGNFKGSKLKFSGLGNLDVGIQNKDGVKRPVTAAETFANAIKGNPDEDEVVGVANTIIQKAVQEYDIDSNISVRFKDESGYKDRYVIRVDGVDYESPAGSSEANHEWLQINMDRVLRGEKPQDGTQSTAKPSFQDWKKIKGNENKSYKDWQNS